MDADDDCWGVSRRRGRRDVRIAAVLVAMLPLATPGLAVTPRFTIDVAGDRGAGAR